MAKRFFFSNITLNKPKKPKNLMTQQKSSRRAFLKNSAMGVVGAGALSKQNLFEKNSEELKIKRYRTMGRTGFKVSDFGSGSPSSEAVLKALLDAGVNVIDTGEQYGNGNNEKMIAGVIKNYDRSKIFINSKLYEEKDFSSKEDVIERANASLERLQTDYVDCMMIHSATSSNIIKDEAFHAGMEVLKKEGKVRSVGVSCHGNNHLVNPEESLETILLTAVDDGRFDVIQLAYNFFNRDKADKVLNACAQKNIGTQIIKSNPVQLYMMMDERINKTKAEGKEPNKYTLQFYEKFKAMAEEAKTFFAKYDVKTEKELMDAAMKYVLSNEKAHTVLWAFSNFQDVETMLAMSGTNLEDKNLSLLEDYKKAYGHLNCRIGCNDCEAACPHHLPVNYIMRYNYYYSVKGRQKEAMEKYAALPGKKPAEVCGDCPGYCEDACSYNVATRSILAMAENHLSFG
jgi:aryl-alcohol dehydrogenase-like predicted oxidoreductase